MLQGFRNLIAIQERGLQGRELRIDKTKSIFSAYGYSSVIRVLRYLTKLTAKALKNINSVIDAPEDTLRVAIYIISSGMRLQIKTEIEKRLQWECRNVFHSLRDLSKPNSSERYLHDIIARTQSWRSMSSPVSSWIERHRANNAGRDLEPSNLELRQTQTRIEGSKSQVQWGPA